MQKIELLTDLGKFSSLSLTEEKRDLGNVYIYDIKSPARVIFRIHLCGKCHMTIIVINKSLILSLFRAIISSRGAFCRFPKPLNSCWNHTIAIQEIHSTSRKKQMKN